LFRADSISPRGSHAYVIGQSLHFRLNLHHRDCLQDRDIGKLFGLYRANRSAIIYSNPPLIPHRVKFQSKGIALSYSLSWKAPFERLDLVSDHISDRFCDRRAPCAIISTIFPVAELFRIMDVVMPERLLFESRAIFVIDIKIFVTISRPIFSRSPLAIFVGRQWACFFSHAATVLFGKREIPVSSGRT